MNRIFTRAIVLSLFLLSLTGVKASDYQVDTLYNNANQKDLASLMRERGEYYFSITISDKGVLNELSRIVSIDKVKDDSVICYANPTEYAKLLSLGYTPTLLTPPSMQEEAVMWTGGDRATYAWDSYLTYDQYVAMMEGFPSSAVSGRHCELVDLGTLTTSNHRRILGIRLNNGQPDGKPKFLYSSTMHGDEVTGMILMLRLIEEFTTSNDTRILNLLDSLDIFIFPNTNPDGTYNGGNNTVNGAKRYNGNNVDLNRHFPDFDDGPHPDGASSYQNETQWMMNLAQEYLFTMGANYHGGAEVMNYPWDTYQPVHPDDAWWKLVSLEYVSKARAVYSSYMSDTYSNGITNGYAWYTISGSRQDYMNYYGQCREITVECSTAKTPSASNLPNFWNYNHNSMLAYMEQCLRGVHGVVRDSQTNEPIQGVSVVVQNHDALGSSVTSHNVGDFHRPIKGGSYTFVFSKENYCTEYVDVTLSDGQRIDLDVYLTPSGSCAMDCYDLTTPSGAGNYVLGYINGTNIVMPTHSSGTASTATVATTLYDNGFSVEQGMIPSQYTLVSTGTANQYYISYNGYYLTRSTSGYGGNRAVTWSASQSANNRWTITSSGISQSASSSWGGGSSTYYLFYSNGSFYTGSSNPNNITFYIKGSCAAAPAEYTVTTISNYTDGGTTTGNGSYEEGETCTVTATPSACYTFLNWTESGEVVSENETYSFEVTSDKELTANYQLVDPEMVEYTESSCVSYTWHGQIYNTSGEYTYETTTDAGCPRIETLYLTIKNPTSSTDVHTACDSYTWINGVTYTSSNSTATYTTTNAVGCDSVIHLNLTINNSEDVTLEPVSACDSYIWHGQTYTESQTLTFDTVTANGCPRHETLVLTINNSDEETITETACDSYTWHGMTYSQSGTYHHNSTTSTGCPLVETLILTINESETENITVTECDEYEWYGETYSTSGTYTHTSDLPSGCTLTETLNLTINNSGEETITVTACDNYTWHGVIYSQSGTYHYNTTTPAGCPLVETIVLTINNSDEETITETACDSYTWHGMTYSQSGTYHHNSTTSTGCPLVETLILTINESETENITVTECDEYEWYGETYSTSGTYTHISDLSNGCTLTETLNLTINNSGEETITMTACDSYTWHGVTYSQSGTYHYNSTTSAGCSLVETIVLTINSSDEETVTETACDSYIWHGQTYTQSGTYHYNSTTSAGCPLVETLNLTIPVVVVTINGDSEIELGGETTLTAEGALTYVWSTGETTQSITVTPAETTTYIVTGTDANGCTATAEVTVSVDGVEELADNVMVYPNPTRNVVNIIAEGIISIRVSDICGMTVFESLDGGDNAVIDMSGFAQGIYMLQVKTPSGTSLHKVVKR